MQTQAAFRLASKLAAHAGKRAAAFAANRSGSTMSLFAFTFAIMMGAAALVIDYGYATSVRARQQAALDAATLAASDALGTQNAEARGNQIASAYFAANTEENPTGTMAPVTLDSAKGEVKSNGLTGVDTWLMRWFGINKLDVTGQSVVARGSGTVEVALVLDNSGSMWPELENLKTAAKQMAGILFVGAENNDKVHVGLVPFAASVNVGAHNAYEPWMDSRGVSPVHSENFESGANRLDLFNQVGVPWAGCVEVRPSPHDTTDAFPTSGNPATLFVPMFAPDEPDDRNDGGNSYNNSYLADDGGSCTRQPRTCVRYSRRGNCREWYIQPLQPAAAQSRMCKYANQSAASSAGPNYNCTTSAILPLTSTKAEVEAAIEGMTANGWTNILQGTTWGWRVLSSQAPFTEGRSESDTDNRKFLVIMSDGENTYQRKSNHNGSMYGAFGYTSKGRLSSGNPASDMNAKTLQACNNAKAAGITVFTVAFREAATSTTARNLLRDCASDPTNALLASDGNGLKQAFQNIGRQITKLRIAG